MRISPIQISGRQIGPGKPCFIIAEMSSNHNQSYQKALEIIRAAKESGADAIKLQTYTPDTITINCKNKDFRIKDGIWSGQTLYELYEKTYTPWEWQPRLKREAEKLGLILFSSPFDPSAVDFLAQMDMPAYKVASFELVDIPLIQHIAEKGKPVIISTGIATLEELNEAVEAVRETGNRQLILLKCVSAYPAPPEEMNLRTIQHLIETFNVPVGLSDHTFGYEVALAAVALGADVIEKHFTISREDGGSDSSFSMEPKEFERMVRKIRMIEKARGKISYEPLEKELLNRKFRRSLFAVKDIKKGERFTEENVRSIRPAMGLRPKYFYEVLGRKAACDLEAGSPLKWEYLK